LARGDSLSEPGVFRAVKQVDCRLQLLPTAKPLSIARRCISIPERRRSKRRCGCWKERLPLQPGGAAYVRLVLRDAALLLPGDRFIIRMFSPVTTIGGGVVLDVARGADALVRVRPPGRALARLDVLASADAAERIALLVRETPFGMGMAGLVERTGLVEPRIAAAVARAPLLTIAQPQPWYVDRAWFQAARDRMVQSVREFHGKYPLQPGDRQSPTCVPRARRYSCWMPCWQTRRRRRNRGRGRYRTVAGPYLGAQRRRAAGARGYRARVPTGRAGGARGGAGAGEIRRRAGASPRSVADSVREKRLLRITDELVVHDSAIEELKRMLAGRGNRRGSPWNVQRVDRRFAQVRHPAAGVPRPRTNHPPPGRRAPDLMTP